MRRAMLPAAWAILAAALCAAEARAQEVERAMRIFDCEFLTAQKKDYPGPDLTRFGQSYGGSMPLMDEGNEESMSVDMLADMIAYNIHPDSWNNSLNRMEFRDGKLVVVQTPDVLDEVGELLAVLRRSQVRLVNVRAWAVEVTRHRLEELLRKTASREQGSLLSADEAAFLLGKGDPQSARVAASVSLTCFSGQRVHGGPLRRHAYVADIDVEVAQKMSTVDPIMRTMHTGFQVDVRPSVVGADDSVLLELRLAWARGADTSLTVDSGVGTIDTPRRDLVAGRTTVLAPRGKAVFFSASHPSRPGYALVFLVQATPLSLEGDRGAKKGGEEGGKEGPRRVLRIYDVRLLTSRIVDFPGPDLDPPRQDAGMAGPAFEDAGLDEGVGLSPMELVELIKTSIEEDSWSNVRNSITIAGTSLVVVQKPQVHEKLAKFLRMLWARRAVLLHATLRCIDIDRQALDRIAPPGSADLALSADQAAALERELGRGKAAVLRFSASTTCFNRQRVHLQTLAQQPVIADVDVEVAEAAAIGDPIMQTLSTGMVFDFRPTLSGDGRHVALDLTPAVAEFSTPVLARLGKGFPNTMHKYDLDSARLSTSITVPDGATVLFIAGAHPSDPNRVRALTLTLRTMRVK